MVRKMRYHHCKPANQTIGLYFFHDSSRVQGLRLSSSAERGAGQCDRQQARAMKAEDAGRSSCDVPLFQGHIIAGSDLRSSSNCARCTKVALKAAPDANRSRYWRVAWSDAMWPINAIAMAMAAFHLISDLIASCRERSVNPT